MELTIVVCYLQNSMGKLMRISFLWIVHVQSGLVIVKSIFHVYFFTRKSYKLRICLNIFHFKLD